MTQDRVWTRCPNCMNDMPEGTSRRRMELHLIRCVRKTREVERIQEVLRHAHPEVSDDEEDG